MKLLQAALVSVGPFEKLVLPFADDAGEPRAITVIHGAGGVGKTSVLSAIALTRPGHCVVLAQREPREAGNAPSVACDWSLGQDEPGRPHPLSVASPNARLLANDEAEVLRRREQALFDRLAAEGGFAFLAISGTRFFSRQPISFSAPLRTIARYDVRASGPAEDASRFDLTRETKQALAYAAISAALAPGKRTPERRFDLLGEAMQHAVDALLESLGIAYRGLDPASFEPMFAWQGRELGFDALPTRARHLVAIAALSVRTVWAAYPHRDPRNSEGVIAIDDVDLHQDTRVQLQLLTALRRALPDVQWILTAASPVLAASTEASNVLSLRTLPEGAGVQLFEGDQARTH